MDMLGFGGCFFFKITRKIRPFLCRLLGWCILVCQMKSCQTLVDKFKKLEAIKLGSSLFCLICNITDVLEMPVNPL